MKDMEAILDRAIGQRPSESVSQESGHFLVAFNAKEAVPIRVDVPGPKDTAVWRGSDMTMENYFWWLASSATDGTESPPADFDLRRFCLEWLAAARAIATNHLFWHICTPCDNMTAQVQC
jgi:hypothetical protein